MTHSPSPQRGAQKSSDVLTDIAPPRFYDFAAFRIDVQRRVLLRDGQQVAIKPKALDTLLALIEHRNRVVDKDELMSWLWPDTVVEEANLSQNVFVVRKALGEALGEQRFIATVARRGYRFVADVTEVRGDGGQAVDREHAGHTGRSRMVIAAMAAVAVVVSGVVAWQRFRPAPTVTSVRSLAVLPLRDVSPGPRQGYLADGMTDALIADLASISSLRVISRQSVMRFRDSQQSLPDIARALGAEAVLEGTVGLAEGRVRLTARLVHGATDQHLWSASYNRPARDVLTLQGELAQAVASAVRATVMPQEQLTLSRRKPIDPQAYDLYLRARYFTGRRGSDEIRKSIDYYQRAIQIDPAFAAAHGGLALSHTLNGAPMETAEASAASALAIDADQPEALTVMAYNILFHDGNWRESKLRFEQILRRQPNAESAVNWYGSLLLDMGRTDEGLVARRRLVELDPLGLSPNNSLGILLARLGRYDEGLLHLRRAIEIDPTYADAHGWLGYTLVRMGHHDEGIAESLAAVRLEPGQARFRARLGHVYGVAGRSTDARRVLRELERDVGIPRQSLFLAQVHAGLGEADLAFERLHQTLRESKATLGRIRSDPLLEPLARDPRFGELVLRLGLPWP